MGSVSLGVIEGTGRFYSGPTLVALERGYFAEQGLDVAVSEVVGTTGITMIADDKLDAAPLLSGMYFFQAWDRARPMAMVADAGQLRPGRGSGGIVARLSLLREGGLRDYADLRGKRLALSPTRGNYDWLVFADALRCGGLAYDDVDVIICGHGPDQHEALKNGTVDLGTVGRIQSIKEGREAGVFDIWKEYSEVSPGRQMWALMFSHKFRSERPEQAKKYMLAYLKGVRDYYGAFEEGVGRDAVLEALANQTGYTRDALATDMTPMGLDPNGYLNTESLANDLTWLEQQKVLPTPIPLEGVVDHSYLEAALTNLGPWRGRA